MNKYYGLVYTSLSLYFINKKNNKEVGFINSVTILRVKWEGEGHTEIVEYSKQLTKNATNVRMSVLGN